MNREKRTLFITAAFQIVSEEVMIFMERATFDKHPSKNYYSPESPVDTRMSQ